MKRGIFIFLSLCVILSTADARRRWAPKQASGGGGGVAFGAVLGVNYVYGNNPVTVITVSSTAAAGVRVVVPICFRTPTDTILTIVDSSGNTYTQDAALNGASGFGQLYIYSSVLGTALTSGVGTITVTANTSSTEAHYIAAYSITGSTGVDVTASNEDSSGSTNVETATNTTTAATVAIGISWHNAYETYTPGTGWTEGSIVSNSDINSYYQSYASSGSKTTGGSWASNARWASIWVAYK